MKLLVQICLVVSTAAKATQQCLISCSATTAAPVKTSVVDGTHSTHDSDSRSIANVTVGTYWCAVKEDNNLVR